jgi:hypothetical protein
MGVNIRWKGIVEVAIHTLLLDLVTETLASKIRHVE